MNDNGWWTGDREEASFSGQNTRWMASLNLYTTMNFIRNFCLEVLSMFVNFVFHKSVSCVKILYHPKVPHQTPFVI